MCVSLKRDIKQRRGRTLLNPSCVDVLVAANDLWSPSFREDGPRGRACFCSEGEAGGGRDFGTSGAAAASAARPCPAAGSPGSAEQPLSFPALADFGGMSLHAQVLC